jgi:hypothetical protein
MSVFKHPVVVLLFVVLLGLAKGALANRFVTLGTGDVTGVYYPVGGAICRLVNDRRTEHGIRCSVESTPGSIYNLEGVDSQDLDLGIAQSDWIYAASQRLDSAGHPGSDLRMLFSLYPEVFTVVVRAASGIHSFEQVLGRRVSVGRPGSGQRATLDVLMRRQGWRLEQFALALEMDPAQQPEALCGDQIDVMLYMLGHPNGAIKEVTRTCASRFIPINGDIIDALIRGNPIYQPMTIPAGLYPGITAAVPTFGVRAVFFTHASLSDDVAYEVVKSVFENFDSFRQLHPAFRALEPSQMVRGPFVVPLHPGALRYYREKGLGGF